MKKKTLKKAERQPISLTLADPNATPVDALEELGKEPKGPSPLIKSIINVLNDPKDKVERLAFETDPSVTNQYSAVFRAKLKLLPDLLLKKIAIQDDLVAAILNARANQLSAFGRPQRDRFAMGFKIELNDEVRDALDDDKKKLVQQRIEAASKMLQNCGHTNGWGNDDQLSFSQYLYMITRNGLTVGRFATEVIRVLNPQTGKLEFHSFRPIDAGTLYRSTPQKEAAQQVRDQARMILEGLKNKKLEPDKFEHDEYSWIQVIENTVRQAFTPEECLVHNLYPVADIELDGYPLTPLDTVINAVTTHINITTHNKLYFQAGRAARGMLVIKSEDIDDSIVNKLRQQFNASINSVNNAWRMPVFGIGEKDEVTWQPIDGSSRDMEFQYLSDNNARVILSAFQMSPEELPGYAHLSRGTNNQALCLSKSSKVLTEGGYKSIEDILGGNKEVQRIKIWTGKAWSDARVFTTGFKQKAFTSITNGSTIETSPDHRFLSIDGSGTPVWKNQSELKVGDVVLANRNPVPGLAAPPSYRGKELSPKMMEVLGWMTGDGNISIRFSKTTGNVKSAAITLFYNSEKEVDIWADHSEALRDFGVNAKPASREVGSEEAEKIKARYGFNNVAKRRIKTLVYDTDFVKWLLDLGFKSSTDGKVIPAFVYALPIQHRQAFLRGFFSADGTLNGGNPRIVIHNDILRGQTRDLLWGLGVRTQFHQGKKKNSIDGTNRQMVAGQSTLSIKDKDIFFERIGFLQPHKQPKRDFGIASGTWDFIPPEVVKEVIGCVKYDRAEQNASRCAKTGCARKVLLRIAKHYGIEVPAWINEYYFENVVATALTDFSEEMADIEVFDDEHAFVTGGVVVHNSESNSEYKLEAHRDLGIRPLISQIEDFLNKRLFPLIDPNLAKLCSIHLKGLDADTAEKESVRLQQDMPVHMTYDDVLQKVEKSPLGPKWAGTFPLNPQWQAILDKYFFVGEIMEYFFDKKGAAEKPEFQYMRDPFFFQWAQFQMQKQQMQMQQQQMQQQQQAQQQQAQQQQQQQQAQQQQEQQPQDTELTQGIDQAQQALGKSEKKLNPTKRRLIAQQAKMVDHIMDNWAKDCEESIKEIIDIADVHLPTKYKS